MVATYREVVVAYLDNVAARYTADGSGNITDEQKSGYRSYAGQAPTFLYIDRIVIRSTSSAFGAFLLYAGSVEAVNLREYVNIGPSNVSDESSPVIFGPGEIPVPRWTGLDASAVATVILTGRYVQRVNLDVPTLSSSPAAPEEVTRRAE